MEKPMKIAVYGVAFIIAVAASFFVGSFIKEQEQIHGNSQRCQTLISLAIDKVEKEDLLDQDTMEALVSNVYGAYQLCEDPHLSKQLHDLWNTLVFQGDLYTGREDVLAEQLRSIAEMLQIQG